MTLTCTKLVNMYVQGLCRRLMKKKKKQNLSRTKSPGLVQRDSPT